MLYGYCGNEDFRDDPPEKKTLEVTRKELLTFYADCCDGIGCWSEDSYRIAEYLELDPSDGF